MTHHKFAIIAYPFAAHRHLRLMLPPHLLHWPCKMMMIMLATTKRPVNVKHLKRNKWLIYDSELCSNQMALSSVVSMITVKVGVLLGSGWVWQQHLLSWYIYFVETYYKRVRQGFDTWHNACVVFHILVECWLSLGLLQMCSVKGNMFKAIDTWWHQKLSWSHWQRNIYDRWDRY